jgi:hypothetical protein
MLILCLAWAVVKVVSKRHVITTRQIALSFIFKTLSFI